ncbi:N-formylglutamate amidohydrolase [Roseobacter cerasinus]|nr:N-formylglutamate amidohydrolase [Roseobacter cerasinus]
MSESAFEVSYPETPRSCVVFASPHSGRNYPWAMLRSSVLDELTIRSSEDAFVDQLFDCAPQYGAPLLKAGAPRAFVDLNRSCDELDPALIDGVRRRGHNPRVASGLGVIPRVVANGRAIYRGKISMLEATTRLNTYWHPYHNMLQGLLDDAVQRHGQAVLIDCHSMPHEAVQGVARSGARSPEIVLGDRFGAAAAAEVVDRVEAAFISAGFTVTRNAPFAGAYVAQAYGRPTRSQHAVQVEIDRAIYMDEGRIEPSERFADVQRTLQGVIAEIAQIGQEQMPLAAE